MPWFGRAIGLTSRERIALVVFIAFAGSTHSATFGVLLALGAAALFFSWLSAKLVPRAGLAPVVASIVLGAAMLLTTNYVVGGRFAWTPGGYGIAFGRMLQDGIVTRYLNDHCPDPRLKLCPYRTELPLDADTFLWGDGIFDQLGRFAGLGDEMQTIVLGSLRDYPVMQIKAALVATAATRHGRHRRRLRLDGVAHLRHHRTIHAVGRAGDARGPAAARRGRVRRDQSGA